MTNRYPFRHMRLTLKLIMAQCALLLATEGVVAWTDQDYALFFSMSEMWHKLDNPTYPQQVGILGAFMRFYRTLIDKMPEGDLRAQCEREWVKVTEGYGDLLKEKTN